MADILNVLSVQNVHAVFRNDNGGLHALNQITFDIRDQEFVCILGPSGSGKSTLLRILAGLLPPSDGKIFYGGELLTGPRRDIGFVFQKANLMPWRDVLHNIILPLELTHMPEHKAISQAQEMVELVGLQGFEDVLPRDLSGGMAQRVAISRALIHDPAVLLLDEPLGALDAMTRERMATEIIRIWQLKRKTVLMVTHSISEALFMADRILVLSQRPGKLILDIEVKLPRPRQEEMRYTPNFGEMARTLRAAIEG